MTFESMAASIFGSARPEELQRMIVDAMEHGYIAALRAASWRMGGVEYIGSGSDARLLSDVIAQIQQRGGPL